MVSRNVLRLTEALETVAEGLAGFDDRIAFVGGTTVQFYIQETELASIRFTDDVDIIVDAATHIGYAKFEQEILRLGFVPDTESKIAIRKKFKNIVVDIMPTGETGWNSTDQWYQEGFAAAKSVTLPSSRTIRILSLPYFLATKFAAYQNRGGTDLLASKDLEDILLILHRPQNLTHALHEGSAKVRRFLAEASQPFLQMAEIDFRELCDSYRVSAERVRASLEAVAAASNG